jgi:hypothetical protein
MQLPRKIPKAPKRSSRWRSQAHCNFVRSHACSNCDSLAGIEVAHVRIGSGAGMGQKPDDFRTVSLCRDCHMRQHSIGEATFWGEHFNRVGRNVHSLVEAFCKASPRAAEIRQVRQERELA